MVSQEVEAEIRGLLAVIRPTEEQVESVLKQWDGHFHDLAIEPEKQLNEFKTMMLIRVQAGIISIVPHRIPV